MYSCIHHAFLPVVWTQRRVWGITLGAFPAHEIPLKLFDCLQGFPLAGKRLHMASWGQQHREVGVREWQVGWKLEAEASDRRKIKGKSVEGAKVENIYARRKALSDLLHVGVLHKGDWTTLLGSSPFDIVQRLQNLLNQFFIKKIPYIGKVIFLQRCTKMLKIRSLWCHTGHWYPPRSVMAFGSALILSSPEHVHCLSMRPQTEG